MSAPTKPWTDVSDADVSSESVTPKDSILEDLRDNLEHVEEMAGASFTAAQAHTHDGTDSATVDVAWTSNLLANATAQPDATGAWSASGPVDASGLVGFAFPKSSTDYVYQPLGTQGSTNLGPMFGDNGADFTVSFFMRAGDDDPSSGEVRFGLSDGSSTTYMANARAKIAFGSVTRRWQRFYAVFPQPTLAAVFPVSTDLRALFRTDTAFDAAVFMSGFMLTLGSYLQPFNFCNQDDLGDHAYYARMTQYTPIFDHRTAMIDAVKVTPS